MSRYLSWLANALLLALCCFFVASTANAVLASWLAPAPEELAPAAAVPAPPASSWQDRQKILDRNLFRPAVAPVAAATPDVEEEELEATKLPLDLIGTVASPSPELSWAAVQDRQQHQTLVLQVGSEIQGKTGNATVERIERKRIVLREGGKLRELALSDTPPQAETRTASRRQPRKTAAQRRSSRRPKPAARPTPATKPAEDADLRGVAQLFSQAQILPRYENGQMVGFQVDSIEAGSVFDEIGLDDGDLITELNGIRITSPEQSAQVLSQLSESTSFSVTVDGPDGPETLQVNLPEE